MKNSSKEITSTRHTLPFRNLSPDEFERLCFWVIQRSGEFYNPEHYGMTGDKGRDIIARKDIRGGKRELWYFNCKRYKTMSFAGFKEELDKLIKHSEQNKDFKPDVIVFVVACRITPSCQDDTKKYAKDFLMREVYFWTDTVFDERVKSTPGAVDEFFHGGINSSEIAEKTAEVVKVVFSKMHQKPEQSLVVTSEKTDQINKEIDEAVAYIRSDDIQEAKNRLFIVLGKIQQQASSYQDELARIYNNLGVCFNQPTSKPDDLHKAKQYIEKALVIKPELKKAKANLAGVCIRLGSTEDIRRAYKISENLWQSETKNPSHFEILLLTIHHHKSLSEAIKFYEASQDGQALAAKSARLLHLIGTMYLEAKNLIRADEMAEKAIELAPKQYHNLHLKARILIMRTQEEDIIPSELKVVPKFKDYKNIEEALELLEQALELSQTESDTTVEEDIKFDILICLLWLKRVREAKYRDIRASLDRKQLDAPRKHQLLVQDFAAEVEMRNYETAYNVIVNSENWDRSVYEEKIRIARIFTQDGAPLQSKNILIQIEDEATRRKDIYYWIGLSINEVLLGNKNLAINVMQKAKDLAVDTSSEKVILSQFNALMLRYASSGEVDRLITGFFDYKKKFPDEKTIESVKALDKEGKPSKEIIEFFQKQSESYNHIKEQFKTQYILSYHLEKILHRPYADILSNQNDPEFTIEYSSPHKDFRKQLFESISSGDNLVIDYAALLNLSKMNLLGHLTKLNKKISITRELFRKIQYELLLIEQADLRRLWSFLTSTKEISIDANHRVKLLDERISEVVDKWFVDSMRLAKANDATFIVDDLRAMRILHSEKIPYSNSLAMIRLFLTRDFIDAKIYSISLGRLAERFYTFLEYSGDDLFRIVMDDQSKITLRSHHLIRQLFLPGSDVKSFTSVFVRFIHLLWKTGSLAEDKVQWLSYLTNTILEFINMQGEIKTMEELKNVAPDFTEMWLDAIQTSNKDELSLIEKQINEIFNADHLANHKETFMISIQKRKKEL